MSNSGLSVSVCGVVLGAILFSISPNVTAQESNLTKIVEHWRERRERVRTLRARLVQEVLIPKGSIAPLVPTAEKGPIPSTDYRFDETVTILLDLESNRFRKERRGQTYQHDLGRFRPDFEGIIFDGERFSAYFPKEEQVGDGYFPLPTDVDASIGTTDLGDYSTSSAFGVMERPVFWACGIVNIAPDARRLQESLEPTQLREHGGAVLGERSCVVLRLTSKTTPTKGSDELWVDLEQNSAIPRWLTYRDGRLWRQIDCSYENKLDDWLPTRWKVTRYGSSGAVGRAVTITVREWQINSAVESSEFVLPLKLGMLVRDESKGEGRHLVEADGRLSPVSVKDGQIIRNSSWSGSFFSLFIVGILALTALWLLRLTLRRRDLLSLVKK